jgi:phenylacetate-coenzyme A ligase PaaK-like adenylate-forming protein
MLRDDLHRFIVAPSDFEEMALKVFAFQYEKSAPYKTYCDRRGANPAKVKSWKAIPLVPVEAFKHSKIYCGTGEPTKCFLTSGTSGGPETRGKHYYQGMDLFHSAVKRTFKETLIPSRDKIRLFLLAASPELAPTSLITWHLHEALQIYGAPGSAFYVDDKGLRVDDLKRDLAEAAKAGEPVILMGTAFAHVHLCDSGLRVRLPPGSTAIHCGGFKGRSREITRQDLNALLYEHEGVSNIVNLYGMTELTSHFYGDEYFNLPPWAAVRILHPDTLKDLPDGEKGLVAFIDLINLDACATVLTQDLGIRRGDRSVTLLGRVPGAEARGCSIAMDEFLSGAAS